MAKRAIKRSKKLFRNIFIFILVFSWIFSGWPQVFNNPPKINEASAATIPSGVIIAWPSTNASIPTGEGWSRVTGLDTYYLQGTTSNPSGTAGGATTHTHTSPNHQHTVAHTHTVPQFAAVATGTATGSGSGAARNTHVHAAFTSNNPSITNNNVASASLGTASNDPPYLDVIWLQSNGTPTGIPAGAIVWYDSDTLPTGWTRQGGNMFLRGAAGAGDGGGTGGSSDAHSHTDSGHTHTEASHTHTGTTGNGDTAAVSAAGSTVNISAHAHPVTSTGTTATEVSGVGVLANGDGQPPFYKLNAIRNDNAGADLPNGIITAWTGTIANIPPDYVLCDGNNGCPNLNNYFIKGANADSEINTTGGALTHTHAAGAAHSHTISNHQHTFSTGASTSGTIGDSTGTQRTANNAGHTHSNVTNVTSGGTTGTQTITADANTDNRPPYKQAAFIQYKPADPTWITGGADFKIYQSASLTWGAGTLICSGTLTDTNGDTISCSSGTVANSTQYRVDVLLKNAGTGIAKMAGSGEYVDHKFVKAGWAGTAPTLGSCAFYDANSDDTAASCTAAWSATNDVRMTNTGTEVKLAATTGTEGFMYLITTGSDVPGTNATSYFDTLIDVQTEDSSKITIAGPAVISIAIDGTDGTVDYGFIGAGAQKSTIDLGDTQVVKNNGNVSELFEIQTTNATNGTQWIVWGSAGSDKFVHEYSSNSGGSWTVLATASTYQSFASNVAANATRSVDLRITGPTISTDFVSKSITITLRASSM